jgi:hypothetical protein
MELQDCSFAVFKNPLVMSDAFDIMKAKFVLSFAIRNPTEMPSTRFHHLVQPLKSHSIFGVQLPGI